MNQSAPSSPDGLPPLRDVIKNLGLRAKKNLGQNFILDLNLTCRIARAAGPLAGRTIVEIGPGPGGLTRALLMEGAARVIVVERDQRVMPALHDIAVHYPGRLDVLEGDALEADWAGLTAAGCADAGSEEAKYKPRVAKPLVVANLPYGIATRLLIGWLETEPWPPWFDRLVLMFQREVAERIVAAPRTKAYGRLSVISQWRTQTRLVLTLPPEAFTPPPKVASALVEFIPRASPSPACDVGALGRVTRAAFGQRRKMLRQSLKQLTAMPELLLAKAGIDPKARPEALSAADFATLAAALDGEREAPG